MQALERGVKLELGDALHINGWRFFRPHFFEPLSVFVGVGQQQFVGHAQLLQQLAPARALRCQVNETIHGGRGGWH